MVMIHFMSYLKKIIGIGLRCFMWFRSINYDDDKIISKPYSTSEIIKALWKAQEEWLEEHKKHLVIGITNLETRAPPKSYGGNIEEQGIGNNDYFKGQSPSRGRQSWNANSPHFL
ncbi:hypothetical protein VNO77_20942 [Canavalia gladiata]|uniref:Uncharacterized protein n=1 Tax=Canavalia gladiata TaxID=3824 RepID=A0AAN9LU93_CANGL